MADLRLNPKEFLKVDIGDVVFDAWMIKPAGFDPEIKYPVIFFIYGEPASSTVQDNWSGGDLWHQFLAQEGYVVMSVDNRGTAVPRGRIWRKSIYEQIGILATDDQAALIKSQEISFPSRARYLRAKSRSFPSTRWYHPRLVSLSWVPV